MRFLIKAELLFLFSLMSFAVFKPVLLSASTQAGVGWKQKGIASWYGGKFQGRLTANGEYFDTHQLTAAHKTLPFNTVVRVTSGDSGLFVDVRVNDRGPFVKGRVIDLSFAAAAKIRMTGAGTAPVEIRVVRKGDGKTFHHLRRPRKPAANWAQVGAYSDEGNARRRAAGLQKSGLNAEIIQEGRFFKVGIPLSGVDSPSVSADMIRRKCGLEPLLRRRPGRGDKQ